MNKKSKMQAEAVLRHIKQLIVLRWIENLIYKEFLQLKLAEFKASRGGRSNEEMVSEYVPDLVYRELGFTEEETKRLKELLTTTKEI